MMSRRVVVPAAENLVDFVTTACNRPEILNETYKSLSFALKGLNLKLCRLFINIDPMPSSENWELNVEVARQYFGEVIYHIPDTPKGNVSRAFKWCVEQVQKPYTFYLEDDWQFVQEFNIMKLISMVKTLPQIASVNLWKTDGGTSNSSRIYLSPSLFKTSHLKRINKLLLPDYSPEKQLRPAHPSTNPYPYGGRILKILKYHGICYKKNAYPMVMDLGRRWMQNNGLKKTAGINGTFLTWSLPSTTTTRISPPTPPSTPTSTPTIKTSPKSLVSVPPNQNQQIQFITMKPTLTKHNDECDDGCDDGDDEDDDECDDNDTINIDLRDE